MSEAYRNLRVERDGAVLRITLARPEVRNAFDDALIDELTRAFREAAEDGESRVVVLAGDGPTFCAGADVAWMRKAGGYSKAENEADAGRMARMLRGDRRVPQARHRARPRRGDRRRGGARGRGRHRDRRRGDGLLARRGQARDPARRDLAVRPAGDRSAGRARLLPDGRPVRRAARPCGSASCTRSSTAGELGAAGERKVASLLTSAPEAVRVAKRLIEQVAWKTPEEAMPLTVRTIAERRASAEAKEGLTAFLEKRKPSWSREIEGMKGTQRRLDCPKCGKVFFAWRPDDLPGRQVKCYFCGHTFEDEAALRPPLAAPAPAAPPPAPPAPAAPAPPAPPAATPEPS